MKDQTWIGVAGVVALAWLGLQLSPMAWAADPTFDFDPTSGVVGETVTLTGSGWIADDGDVKIFLPDADADTDEPWVTASVDEAGEFSRTAAVPTLPAGQKTFFACQVCIFDGGDAPPSDSASFVVQPDLQLGQQEGLPGTVIGVTGSGWALDAGDVLLFANRDESLDEENQLVAITAELDGTIGPGWTFKVPPRPAGAYTFYACQQCSNGDKSPSAEVAFEITDEVVPSSSPKLLLDPKTASVGQSVTASGAGWSDAAGPASVYADESAMLAGEDPLDTVPVSRGAFTTTITVPDTEAASLSIYACQKCGGGELDAVSSLDIEADVQPRAVLQIVPSTGSPGAEVRATGTGWRDGEVTLFARRGGGDAEQVSLEPATAEDGAFEQTVTVPPMEPGRIEIVGCQQCGEPDGPRAAVPFTVVAAPQDRPTLGVDPRSAQPGDTVTVSGEGWLAEDGEVTVYLESAEADDRTELFLQSPGRDSTFSKNVEAPDQDPGDYRVVACQRCDDAPGFPEATETLELEDGSDTRSTGTGFGALLVVVVVVWLLMRSGRAGPPPEPDPQAPPDSPLQVPKVRAVTDATFEVEVYATPGRRANVELSRLDVIGRPDPGGLSDQVEVSP